MITTLTAVVNPFTGDLQLIRADSAFHLKDSVDTFNSLPTTDNTENDVRITEDDDKMYTWSIPATSGILADWKLIGNATSIDWSVITNKPASDVADIDDAVTKRHTQGTDQKLDEGGGNEVAVADVKDAVDKKHTQDTDQKLDDGGVNEVSASELITAVKNIIINAFRIAVNGSLSVFNMIDGIVDEYEDETGINTGSSTNESYDSTDDFYEPLTTPGDINVNTQLMLHCNGADESTTFTDSSPVPHTVTAVADAQIDTAEKKWGTGSALFDGTGDYLSIPSSTDLDFLVDNTASATIDCWIKTDSPSQYGTIFDRWNSGTSQNQGWCNINSGRVEFGAYQGGGIINMSTASILVDTNWHHIAIVKVASEYAIYFDGVQVEYVSDSSEVVTNTAPFLVGSRLAGAGGVGFDGWIDEFKYQDGNPFSASPDVGLTDTFDVPTSEYSTIGETFDMTLISDIFTAEAQPDEARFVILEEDIDSITLNTDLKVWVSEDSGSNWHQITLVDDGNYDTDKRILTGSVALTDETDTNMIYKITTHNLKNLKIHASALSWN